MIASQPRANAILPMPVDVESIDKVGYFVMKSSDNVAICDDPGSTVIGVIVQGAPDEENASIAIVPGGLAGTVRVKLAGPVQWPGTRLQLTADGRVKAEDWQVSRQIVGMAMEKGVEGDLIEAVVHVGIFRDAGS